MTFSDKLQPQLDIRRAAFGQDGMHGYYWPLPLDAAMPARSFLYERLVPLVRDADPHDPDTETLRVTLQYLILGALRLFEAAALVREFERDGVRPQVPDRFETLRVLLDGFVPPVVYLPALDARTHGGRIPAFIKRPMRAVQWNHSRSGARIARALWPIPAATDLVTIDSNPLLVSHARRDNRVLRFSPLTDWFPGASFPAAETSPLSPLLMSAARIVEEAFVAGGQDPEAHAGEWARRWLRQAHTFVSFHLGGLRTRRLPAEMWFSCAGATIWSRMLAHAVRTAGGYVVSHDHGFGNAQVEQSAHHFTEFHFSDEFYTYNRLQAHVRRRELRRELLLDATAPKITSPPFGEARFPLPGKGRKIHRRGRIRRVLFAPTIYFGLHSRLTAVVPDPVALDFRARLLAHLQAWGIELLHKPHPEGSSMAPDGFAEAFGFVTDTRPFEQVSWDCDAYLIDYPNSTTTRKILSSDRPVILLHMGYPELLPEARALLERRCSLLDVTFGSDNRANTDWEQLRGVLEAGEHEFDMGFPDSYYSGIGR